MMHYMSGLTFMHALALHAIRHIHALWTLHGASTFMPIATLYVTWNIHQSPLHWGLINPTPPHATAGIT